MSGVSDERREQMRWRALNHTDYPGEGFRIIQKAGKAQISYEEAKSLIVARDDGYNACIKYEDGWNFYKTANNGQRDGGAWL